MPHLRKPVLRTSSPSAVALASLLVLLTAGLQTGCYHIVNVGDPYETDSLTCWGDPSNENTVSGCAIFARADAPDTPGDGTLEHPYTSLQSAIDAASTTKKRVFACGDAPFEEPISIVAPVEVWGGFDCDTWHYNSAAHAAVVGPPDMPALSINPNGAGALVVSLAFTAPPSEKPGGSSVAVVVDRVDTQTFLWRCDITAGDGTDGLDGDPPVAPGKSGTDAAFAGTSGEPTSACTAVLSVEGGDAGALDCEDGKSLGGKGGFGGTAPNGTGQNGSDGMPLPQDNPMLYGVGGEGQSGAADCLDGTLGAPGGSGQPGEGAQTQGALTMQGILPVDGKAGSHGARGGGGGGGGGARAGVFCPSGASTIEGTGASGGGGGSGGCGGKGGNGGMAGGSSIGVVSLGGKLVLNLGTITVGKGGKGGAGGAGQPGGPGGKGALGGAASGLGVSVMGCAGGDGGTGGTGGPGGGGRGGHSVGVAYNQDTPISNYVDTLLGEPGKGGAGGPTNETPGRGADGKVEEMGQFSGF